MRLPDGSDQTLVEAKGVDGAYPLYGTLETEPKKPASQLLAKQGDAFGAVLLGARHPIGAMWAALLFGVFDALSIIMPNLFTWIPAELVQSIPFLVTIIALILFSLRAQRARRVAVPLSSADA